jgi:hypothetical protein
VSLLDLSVLYLALGASAGVAVYLRRQGVGSIVMTIILWPIWAPIALVRSSEGRSSTTGFAPGALGPFAARIEAALREGADACAGTPLAVLLPRAAADRIVAEVTRIEARRAELDALLGRGELDVKEAERRVGALETEPATSRALATARLHLENCRRLHRLREEDTRAIGELVELVEALRTQLVLARFAGTSIEGVGDVVNEMWARVEALGEALAGPEALGSGVPVAASGRPAEETEPPLCNPREVGQRS